MSDIVPSSDVYFFIFHFLNYHFIFSSDGFITLLNNRYELMFTTGYELIRR